MSGRITVSGDHGPGHIEGQLIVHFIYSLLITLLQFCPDFILTVRVPGPSIQSDNNSKRISVFIFNGIHILSGFPSSLLGPFLNLQPFSCTLFPVFQIPVLEYGIACNSDPFVR